MTRTHLLYAALALAAAVAIAFSCRPTTVLTPCAQWRVERVSETVTEHTCIAFR